METLILSKTEYGQNSVCVGGIVLENNQFVRLLNPDGFYQSVDTQFNIGDVWDLTFRSSRRIIAPHVEDVILYGQNFKRTIENISSFIQGLNILIWRGPPDNLFEGLLNWTPQGSGYINEEGGIPSHSVGFWISDRVLRLHRFSGIRDDGTEYSATKYNYPNINGWRSLPFKGCGEPLNRISSGTLIRVSLAKWWDTKGRTENRCALQLSGWYDNL